jgi:hypothetical protein
MRPDALRPKTARAAAWQSRMRTRLTPGEKPCRKRMATLACVYDAEPEERGCARVITCRSHHLPGRYPRVDRSTSTGKGTLALTTPVNTSPSR